MCSIVEKRTLKWMIRAIKSIRLRLGGVSLSGGSSAMRFFRHSVENMSIDQMLELNQYIYQRIDELREQETLQALS